MKKASEDGKHQEHFRIERKIHASKCCRPDWDGVRRGGVLFKSNHDIFIPNLQKYLESDNFIRLSNLKYSNTFSIVENFFK